MNLTSWDLLINVMAMLFWFRLWIPEERDLYFNPYLAALWRFSEHAVAGLRTVFIRTPDRLIALLFFLVLLLFRGIAFYVLARRSPETFWPLRLGFEESHLYFENASFLSFLGFSFLSFALFLFVVWGLAILYAGQQRASFNHASRTLFHVSKPFSLIRMEWRPLALLAVGIALAALVNYDLSTNSRSLLADALNPSALVKCALSALEGWVDVLKVLQLLMVVLIIGSWAAMFSTSPELGLFCREWVDLLLGPLRRFPLHLGMFDLTPLIFFFALKYAIHPLLHIVLKFSYRSLP